MQKSSNQESAANSSLSPETIRTMLNSLPASQRLFIRREVARLSPGGLAGLMSETYETPAHIQLLDSWLVDSAYGRRPRIVVTMPPRHGKSYLCSHVFPAWYVGTFPTRRIILASYEADFAAQWGRKARDLLEDQGKSVFGVSVSQGSSAASRWDVKGKPGGMQTAGVGGPITGKGADVLLIDDPVKNADQADSAGYRDMMKEWFRSVAYTRLEPKGSIIVIQTRWHEDDLAGWILNDLAKKEAWDVINFPAIADAEDVTGRKPGDALWPSRFSRERLKVIEETVGSRWWQALYQQRPSPAEGNIFKREWFREFREQDDLYVTDKGSCRISDCWRFGTADLATSVKESADYTAIASWAVTTRGEALLLDVRRERLAGPDIIPALRATMARWELDWMGVESAGFQTAIVQMARREGLTVKPIRPRGDKVSRAHAASARFDAGLVAFRAGATWRNDLEEEMLRFPTGKHDDQVDAVVYGVNEIGRRAVGLDGDAGKAPDPVVAAKVVDDEWNEERLWST